MKKNNSYWFVLSFVSLILGVITFIVFFIGLKLISKDCDWLMRSVIYFIVSVLSVFISGTLGYLFQKEKDNPKKMKFIFNCIYSLIFGLLIFFLFEFITNILLKLELQDTFIIFILSYILPLNFGFNLYFDFYSENKEVEPQKEILTLSQ